MHGWTIVLSVCLWVYVLAVSSILIRAFLRPLHGPDAHRRRGFPLLVVLVLPERRHDVKDDDDIDGGHGRKATVFGVSGGDERRIATE